jgi:hypothetical protein
MLSEFAFFYPIIKKNDNFISIFSMPVKCVIEANSDTGFRACKSFDQRYRAIHHPFRIQCGDLFPRFCTEIY